MLAIHANVRSLPANRDVYVSGQPEEDALEWAACMLRATTERGSDAWIWADRMLESGDGLIADDRRIRLEMAFFEIPRRLVTDLF
jgi:hypothetical protein